MEVAYCICSLSIRQNWAIRLFKKYACAMKMKMIRGYEKFRL